MCSSLFQLAPGLRDLSQAEKRIAVKYIKLGKFTKWNSKLSWMHKTLSENRCDFVNLLRFTYQLFSSQFEINHVIQEPTGAIQNTFIPSKRDGASFLRSTLPTLTVKLQKMMEPTDQISYPAGGNSGKLVEKPALSDRDFRSFLDNVGELVRYESIFYTEISTRYFRSIFQAKMFLQHLSKEIRGTFCFVCTLGILASINVNEQG